MDTHLFSQPGSVIWNPTPYSNVFKPLGFSKIHIQPTIHPFSSPLPFPSLTIVSKNLKPTLEKKAEGERDKFKWRKKKEKNGGRKGGFWKRG